MTLRLQRLTDWRALEQQTAVEWLLAHAGRRIYETIFEPMLRGLLGRFKEQLGYPTGSFGEVFDVLGERIRSQGGVIHLSSGVQRIVVEDGRATGLDVTIEGGEPKHRDYDATLATVPSYVLPRLVEGLPDDFLGMLTDKTYLSAVLVILVLDRQLSPHYWTYVGDRDMPFLGVIEHTNFMPPEVYGGGHIVYLTNYLEREDRLYAMSAEELYREYLPHLRRLNPGFDESWVREYHHHKVDAAQPIVTRGYSERIPPHRTPIEGLWLANTTQIYPEDRGTNYSVRMGRQVAAMMADNA